MSMNICECRNQIEQLRKIMELTFDNHGSFTAPPVLEASQRLDDALVQYRLCPFFDSCNESGCRVSWKDVDQLQLGNQAKNKMAG
jgi:hypothetical protein